MKNLSGLQQDNFLNPFMSTYIIAEDVLSNVDFSSYFPI